MTNTTKEHINCFISVPWACIDITDALGLYTLDEILRAIEKDHPTWRYNRTEKSVWDENGVIAVFDMEIK